MTHGQALLLPLAILLSLVLSAVAAEKTCTVTQNYKIYDLNPLSASKDYQLKTPGGRDFVLNVCKAVSTETWGAKVENPSEVAGFVRRDHGDISIGKVNTTPVVEGQYLKLFFTEGSKCKNSDIRASSMIQFICDTSVAASNGPRLVGQLPPGDEDACAYFLEWRTKYACPTSEGGGFWGFIWTLILISISLLLSYLVLGSLYNRFVLNLRGWDQVPQFSVESMKYHASEAWDWAQDIMGRNGSGHGNGYAQPGSGFERRPAPARGNSRVNPVSHQAEVAGIVSGGVPSSNPEPIGFVRPSKPIETNPVSHQTQVNTQMFARMPVAAPAVPQTQPPQQQQSSTPPPKKFDVDTKNSSAEERTFMLGDDDEEAGQELGDVPRSTSPSRDASDGSDLPSDAATLRGRAIPGGGVIRL